MAIRGRHIRHDWQTFVDWPQKTVKGVCGVTTQRHLAGIPGFTEQPELVESGGKKWWGWCATCVRGTFQRFPESVEMPDEVKVLYTRVSEVISPQYYAMKDQAERRRKLRQAGFSVTQSNAV